MEMSEAARRAVEAVKRTCERPSSRFQQPPKNEVQPLDRGTMGTILHCPGCGERMAGIPHSELVDEHFGCAGCGKVFYECDGRLWVCKFPGQDVPGWRLKHELPLEAKPATNVVPKTSAHDFRTPSCEGDAR